MAKGFLLKVELKKIFMACLELPCGELDPYELSATVGINLVSLDIKLGVCCDRIRIRWNPCLKDLLDQNVQRVRKLNPFVYVLAQPNSITDPDL